MSPKEKAQEIFGTYYKIQVRRCPCTPEVVRMQAAAAVDLLIKETGKKYWYEVMNELKQL